MIEKPKAGQRVVRLFDGGDFEWTTIHAVYERSGFRRAIHEWDSGGRCDEIIDDSFHDSPQSAAAALRNQAQELLLVASKLEQEETNA